MEYPLPVVTATFLARPNRFIAQVRLKGEEITVHVANTGRCRELLRPGCTVVLEPAAKANRRTPYTLVAVYKGRRLINMDSQAPNKVALEALQQGLLLTDEIKPERTWGNSRFDLSYRQGALTGFIEVKGVTLEEADIAYFPDAPTERGTKHILELCHAQQEGFRGHIWFIVQMAGIREFRPNDRTDSAFGAALRQGAAAGLDIRAFGCQVTPQGLTLAEEIPVQLT